MICKKCGFDNDKSALYCRKCKANLVEEYMDDYNKIEKNKELYDDYDPEDEYSEKNNKNNSNNNKTRTKTKRKTKTKAKTKEKNNKEKRKRGKDKVYKERTSFIAKVFILFLMLIVLILSGVLAFAGYKYYEKNYNIEVPDLKGLTYEQAQLKLAKKDLNIDKKEVEVDNEEESGIVIKQNKKAKTKVKKDTTIIVSIGVLDDSYKVPNFVGKNVNEVIEELTKEKINYNILYEESNKYDENIVIKQSITKYSKIKRDTTITLTISKESNEDVNKENDENIENTIEDE